MPKASQPIPTLGQIVFIWPRSSSNYCPERNHSGGLVTVAGFSMQGAVAWVSFTEIPGLFYRWDMILERQKELAPKYRKVFAEFVKQTT